MPRGGSRGTPTKAGRPGSSRGRQADTKPGSPSLRSLRSPRMVLSSSRAPISPPPLRKSRSSVGLPGQPGKQTVPDVDQLVERLTTLRREMGKDHNQLGKHVIESTKATDRRVHSGKDLFAELSPNTAIPGDGESWRIRFKDHTGNGREEHFRPDCIKSTREAVPRYFNHHVEVQKNVVAPQTSMAFYPHKGDLDSPRKQKKWKGYIKELDKSEIRSGLDSIKVDEKRAVVIHYERIFEVSRYLELWLEEIGLPGLDKWVLLKAAAEENHDRFLSAQSRARILASPSVLASDPKANDYAEMFLEAWELVFKQEKAGHGVKLPEIELLSVLQLDGDIIACIEPKSDAESSSEQPKDGFEYLEAGVETHSELGCLICFKHSCEHGFYTDSNERERFSLEKGTIARRLTEKRKRNGLGNNNANNFEQSRDPCNRKCYMLQKQDPPSSEACDPWTDDERKVLKCISVAAASSQIKSDPICRVAGLLDRECFDVFREYQITNISLPTPEPKPEGDVRNGDKEKKMPNLHWYQQDKKKLSKRHGADKYHRPNWDHIRRDIDDVCALRGCDHDGPCTEDNPDCPCASKGQFCEKFCGCSVENCAYRFTGCACHSQGRTCLMDQKGEECICIQLNRECDPDLCGSCGALERADPKNAHDEHLHSKGCQNCSLQRGVAKPLVMGKSQFHGYGLFAAENIRKDSFIIEYAGELVSGNEGDRRYIRRQNLFDGTKALSFNFTLLKECDVWIDGARYGNLSRYINHESSGQRCNMLPRIVLVNGGFRIEFRAKRNIKAWEELSFDYGEDFGLDIEKKTGKKIGRPRGAARKNARSSRRRFSSSESEGSDDDSGSEPEETERSEDVDSAENSRPSRKRKRDLDDTSEEDDYLPTGSDKSLKSASGRESQERRPATRGRSGRARGSTRGRGGRDGRGAVAVRHTRVTRKTRQQSDEQEAEESEEEVDLGLGPGYRTTRQKRRRLNQVLEIDDSEDEEDEGGDDDGQDTNQNDEDEEEEDGEDGEDDDQEETTPPKRDQPSRSRKQPSKFDGHDIYGLKPARGGKK